MERTLLPGPMGYIGRGGGATWTTPGPVPSNYRRSWRTWRVSPPRVAPTVVLPPPSAWAAQFYRVHSILEWGGDERSNGVTYLFWDLSASARTRN